VASIWVTCAHPRGCGRTSQVLGQSVKRRCYTRRGRKRAGMPIRCLVKGDAVAGWSATLKSALYGPTRRKRSAGKQPVMSVTKGT